ncbi:MAG TPA: hypothetical protein VJW20_13540 [Candidatus Angelobacter sp.]|nr:hypothetical protein [Candidatus Angelobacter sp.]
MWITRWAAATLLLLTWISPAQGPSGSTQKISIRLVDVSSGRAYANETIQVQFHIPQVAELQTLEGKTAIDGGAEFHLPETISSKIAVIATNERLYPCYRSFPIDTRTVIRDGLVSRCAKPTEGCRCKFSAQVSNIQSKPGELVLFARPLTRWERFLGHIWE